MNKDTKEKQTTKKEEFDRSVCMSYFDDHRQLVKRIERLQGIEMAYRVQNLIIDYGLDGIKPTDEELLQFVPEPVLNQIDQNQKRRSKGFLGEDLEVSRSIILLHRDHPELSQNAISKQLDVSKGKVNKTLQKYKNGEYEGIINLDDNTLTITSTSTITSTITNTGVTDDQRDRVTTCPTELADAQTNGTDVPNASDEANTSDEVSFESETNYNYFNIYDTLPMDLTVFEDISEDNVRDLHFNSKSHYDMFDDYEFVDKIYEKYIECCKDKRNASSTMSLVKGFMKQYNCDENAIETCVGYFLYQNRKLKRSFEDIKIDFEQSVLAS